MTSCNRTQQLRKAAWALFMPKHPNPLQLRIKVKIIDLSHDGPFWDIELKSLNLSEFASQLGINYHFRFLIHKGVHSGTLPYNLGEELTVKIGVIKNLEAAPGQVPFELVSAKILTWLK